MMHEDDQRCPVMVEVEEMVIRGLHAATQGESDDGRRCWTRGIEVQKDEEERE